jgi:hypothetical protein
MTETFRKVGSGHFYPIKRQALLIASYDGALHAQRTPCAADLSEAAIRTLITSHRNTHCNLSAAQDEVILAQEQGTDMRSAGVSKGLEAEFGVGFREGTLVLTNKRLIFVCTDEKGMDLPVGYFGDKLLLYSEVEDLDGIPSQSPNIFIPLDAASVKGRKAGLGRPTLEVKWKDKDGDHNLIFTETLTGRRKRNLNDWAPVVEKLKNGTQKLLMLPTVPSTDSLEGKVMHILADMQEKGVFEIEEDVAREYNVDLDSDDVQDACDRLASQHLLTRFPDSSGDTFYRRLSPLGDDLSS